MKRNLRNISFIIVAAVAMVIFGCTKDDTTDPVVTLKGDATMTIDFKGTFTDPGATADDDKDGTLTVTTSGTVDVNNAGTYTITYTATDEAGNEGTATRTVIVILRNTSVAGTYKTTETCTVQGTVGEYDCAVNATGSNKMDITFTNFGNFNTSITLTATLTGTTGQSMTISSQVVQGITFTGSGTITSDGKKMTITYTDTDINGTDNCTATWNKQ